MEELRTKPNMDGSRSGFLYLFVSLQNTHEFIFVYMGYVERLSSGSHITRAPRSAAPKNGNDKEDFTESVKKF